ncbi:MAG: chemotaxis protein CheC [Gaiellales bacterium]
MNLSEIQLDALGELANIGSGNAATALSSMVGVPIDLSVPHVRLLELADAVDAAGDPAEEVSAVLLPVVGDLGAHVILLFGAHDAEVVCGLLGVEADSEIGLSALCEIGNIVGTSYVSALGAMCGMELEPAPPQGARDMLGAIVATVLGSVADDSDTTLFLDTDLVVEGTQSSIAFLLVPEADGVGELLRRLGLGD